MNQFDELFNEVGGDQPAAAAPPPPVASAGPVDEFEATFAEVSAPNPNEALARIARDKAEIENYSALSGSDFENFLAGIGSGATNIARNVGNVIPGANALTKTLFGFDVSDEAIAEQKRIDQELSNTKAGMGGQFVGEMATLAPLGAVGGGVKLATGATKLPTAMRVLAATGEGALAGSLVADPNERLEGAGWGSLTGGILSLGGAGVSRVAKDGYAKMKPEARRLLNSVEKFTGKKSSVPMTLAADVGKDAASSKASAFSSAASMLPSAKGKMERQAQELAMDVYEMNLSQAFSGKAKTEAVRVLRETGDMTKALEAGKNAKSIKSFSPSQQILYDASRKASGGRYTPTQLRKAAEEAVGEGDLTSAPFRQTAMDMEAVLPKGMETAVGQSNVAARDFYHNLGNLIGAIPDAIPGLGPLLGSQSIQNFLMGNTKAQRVVQKALETKNGKIIRRMMSDLRRAASVQPADEELPTPQGYAQDAVEATTGFLGAN